MGLHHWYHVWADGDWQTPVNEHLQVLDHSGLLAELSTCNVGIVGSETNRANVTQALLDAQPVTVAVTADEGWEQTTQVAMWHWCRQHGDGLVLYAHTKGAANYDPVNTAWRRDMEYHCVCEWRHCIAAFDNPAITAAGAHWIPNPRHLPGHESTSPHAGIFGGNYWWTRTELLAQGGPPRTDYRHGAEAWLGDLAAVGVPMNPSNIHDRCPNPIIRSQLHATHHCGHRWPD